MYETTIEENTKIRQRFTTMRQMRCLWASYSTLQFIFM